MGIRQRISNFFNTEKRGINFIDSSGSSIPIDTWIQKVGLRENTPILESIFETYGLEFSKHDLMLMQYDKETKDHRRNGGTREEPSSNNSKLADLLYLRPNQFMTADDFKYIVGYQLAAYGNSLSYIRRKPTFDGRNEVESIELLDMEDIELGHGFQFEDGTLMLKLRKKSSGLITLVDYNDIVHVRGNPNNVFKGDKAVMNMFSSFQQVFDDRLRGLLTEMKESGHIEGIIKLGKGFETGAMGMTLANEDSKLKKQQDVIKRIKATGSLLVLDSGEEWVELKRTFRTASKEDIDNVMSYLYKFNRMPEKIADGTATLEEFEAYYVSQIQPVISRFVQELTYKVLTQTARTQGYYIDSYKNMFEFMPITQVADAMYKAAGTITADERRRLVFNLPSIEGGNVLELNKNFEQVNQNMKGGG